MRLVKPLDLERVPERHNRFVEADTVLPDILGLWLAPDEADRRREYFTVGGLVSNDSGAIITA
jgi:hypothetical protein